MELAYTQLFLADQFNATTIADIAHTPITPPAFDNQLNLFRVKAIPRRKNFSIVERKTFYSTDRSRENHDFEYC